MMLLDRWRQNEERVRQAGTIALERAREAGVPAFYRDPLFGEGIVKHMPDGSRLLTPVPEDGDHVTSGFAAHGSTTRP